MPRGEAALKKLNPDTKEKYTRLFSKKDGSALFIRSGYVVLKPGENVGEHSTDDAEEILIVIGGEGTISLGEAAPARIEKDSAVYIPPRTPHDVKNTGEENLRYVFITS